MWYTEDTEGELFEARFRICRQGGISMKTTFVGKRQEQTAEFISSAEKKLGKFDRFFEDATAQIKTDKKKDGESVELTIFSGGRYLYVRRKRPTRFRTLWIKRWKRSCVRSARTRHAWRKT